MHKSSFLREKDIHEYAFCMMMAQKSSRVISSISLIARARAARPDGMNVARVA
jgi:hypothetical protein